MLRYLLIAVVFSAIYDLSSNQNPVDLVDVLVRNGEWILAAAASTCVPPPYFSCVNISVSLLPYKSECIMSNINLTSRLFRNVQFIGTNTDLDVEINSKGPIHQYMIKRRNESLGVNPLVQNEVDWEAAVNQPLCWWPKTFPRQFINYRYVITPVDNTKDAVFVVGIKTRSPVPEYETAIFTKGIMERNKVQRMVDVFNWRNYEKNRPCREHSVGWPKTVPWYWIFFPYCLPRLHIMCAKGYHLHDLKDPVNLKTTHENFALRSPPSFAVSKETESILVVHDK